MFAFFQNCIIIYELFMMFLTSNMQQAVSISANDETVNQALEKIPQNCSFFVKDFVGVDELIVPFEPEKVMKSYLTRYFSPWHDPFISFSIENLFSSQKRLIEKYLQNPGWGANNRPNSVAFMESVRETMDLTHFPNCKAKAITLRATNLRAIPTVLPSYSRLGDYPFDNLQESLLSANEPVYILHRSKNGIWQFVIVEDQAYGWVQSIDLAHVSHDFIKEWETGQYVTPVKDGVEVVGEGPLSPARLGQLIPLALNQNQSEIYRVLVAKSNLQGHAVITIGKIQKHDVNQMPLKVTLMTIAERADVLMGQPYGWGTLNGNRDCSATVQDVLMAFGLWLPRNSGNQAKSGIYRSLANLTNEEKEQQLIQEGIPGLTLIHMPGHIMLYLGEKARSAYAYNTIWGLRTKRPNEEDGRAVLGKTVLMPLTFGKQFNNTNPFISRVTGMVNLKIRLIHS